MEHKWNANGWNANGTQMERKWNAKLQNGTQMERNMYNYTELMSKLSPHEIPSNIHSVITSFNKELLLLFISDVYWITHMSFAT